jgi:hypothetical protein
MPDLRDLIEAELKDGDFAYVDIQKLQNAAQDYKSWTLLTRGLCIPDVAVIGEWSPDEKLAVREIINARKQGHSWGHAVGRAFSGYDDPIVAAHKNAYQRLEAMEPGQVARVYVGETAYLMAAFPAEMLATSTVLFVK